jgi:hypothetical protein
MNKTLLLAIALVLTLSSQRRPDPRSVPRKVPSSPNGNHQTAERPSTNQNRQTDDPTPKGRPVGSGSASQAPQQKNADAAASGVGSGSNGGAVPPTQKTVEAPTPSGQNVRPPTQNSPPPTPEPIKETKTTAQNSEAIKSRSEIPPVQAKEPEVEIKKPAAHLPQESRPSTIEETGSPSEGFTAKFSKHYEGFVQNNIDLFEKVLVLFQEKIQPYYHTIKANNIAASLVIGFFYTFIILRLALKILPSKNKAITGESKNYDKQFERLENLIKENSAGKSETDKKLESLLKRLTDLQNSFEAFKNDKQDDEFLDFLGKNIEDVWREIGNLKSRNNDIDNSNLDSLNAKFEPRAPNKNDKEGTPEEIDFDNEKFKLDDIAKIANEDIHSAFNEGSLPSAIKSPLKPVANTLLKRPVPNKHPLAKSPLKPETENVNEKILTSNIQKEKEEGEPVQASNLLSEPPAMTATLNHLPSQSTMNNLGEESETPGAKIPEERPSVPLPPKTIVSNNIFANRNKLPPKSKNHITMPSIPNMPPSNTLSPVPQIPQEQPVEENEPEPSIEATQQNQPEPAIDFTPEVNSQPELQQSEEVPPQPTRTEEPQLVKPPLMANRFPPLPNPILKAKPKLPQMVKPLPKIQPSISDSKGGDKTNLI